MMDKENKYILNLLAQNKLEGLQIDLVEDFVDFVRKNQLSKETLKSLPILELQVLVNQFNKENPFDKVLALHFKEKRREDFRKQISELELSSEISSPAASAMRISRRKITGLSIAASLVFAFLVWQPQHLSNDKIFEDYQAGLQLTNFAESNLSYHGGETRGEEAMFQSFTLMETNELKNAVRLSMDKQFLNALTIFDNYTIVPEQNPGLAFHKSICLINSNKAEIAIPILAKILENEKVDYLDEVKFQLAIAYLSVGNRSKTRSLLEDFIKNESEYSKKAKSVLSQLRWF